MQRRRLPNRRHSEILEFSLDNLSYVLQFSRFPSGELGELFLEVAKPGEPMNIVAKDLATTVSIALQYGIPVKEIMLALSQTRSGKMLGPLGRALEEIERNEKTEKQTKTESL